MESFQIENKFGKIFWEGGVDILEQNLEEIVQIEFGKVEVYPDEETKPEVGQKLNRECLITLF